MIKSSIHSNWELKFTKSQIFSILVANMIGTGVFTSLGYQVVDIKSGFAIMLLWIFGGVIAILGSMSYAMLGIVFPRSGGEYNYITQIYNPSLGFVSGWVSFLIGFAAPIALAAFAFGIYLNKFSDYYLKQYHISFSPLQSAISIVLILTIINIFNKRIGAEFQKIFTILKILIILSIIFLGLFFAEKTSINYSLNQNTINDIFSSEFFLSMYFVTYSYSGWNAACYITEEIHDIERTLPKILITSATFVCVLYVLLNYVFLKVIPIGEMVGVLDIGHIFANKILGINLGGVMTLVICFILISTINSMIIVGSRISVAIGEDHKKLRFFSLLNQQESPYVSILIQSILVIIYLITASFESLIIYVGFVISLFSCLAVLGIFLIKNKDQLLINKLKSFGYPVIPLLFLAINFMILVYGLLYKPIESFIGLIICALGFILYYFISNKNT